MKPAAEPPDAVYTPAATEQELWERRLACARAREANTPRLNLVAQMWEADLVAKAHELWGPTFAAWEQQLGAQR